MNTPNDPNRLINPTPRARFQVSSDNVSKHRDLVDRNEFQRGADFALLQYSAELTEKESNPTVIGLKIAGAHEFLKTFRLLSEKPDLKPMPRPNDNLMPQ